MAYDPDFVAVSTLDEEENEGAIPVRKLVVHSADEGEAIPVNPLPYMRTIQLPSGTVTLLEGQRNFRRQVTIIQFSATITIELSYDSDFRAPSFIRMSSENFIIPLFAGQELYARQLTATDQDISVVVEPRGNGR